MPSMSSFKPYLFTAYYNWIVDNGVTPHLLIDTSVRGVQVPEQYAQNNSMILSISPSAIADYEVNDKGISFKAMFHGISEDVVVPFKAMRQLIAVETGGALPIGQALAVFDDGSEDEDDFSINDEDEEFNQEAEDDGPQFSSVDENEDSSDTQSTKDEQTQKSDRKPAFSFVTDD